MNFYQRALELQKETGESFACPTNTQAYPCGHDMHTAIYAHCAKNWLENHGLKNQERTLP